MTQIELSETGSAAQVASRILRSLDLGESTSEVMDTRPTTVAWWFAGISGLCVITMLCAGIFGSHDCRVAPIPLALGLQTEVSVALPANTPCTILVQSGSSSLAGLTIDAPPEQGTVTPRGGTGVVYRPRTGFKGADAFDFSLHGRSSATDGAATIRVRAMVN